MSQETFFQTLKSPLGDFSDNNGKAYFFKYVRGYMMCDGGSLKFPFLVARKSRGDIMPCVPGPNRKMTVNRVAGVRGWSA
jgi:hypothetical protein